MRTALASALLAALLCAAAASHVCDSGWERLYDATPDGQRYADRNTNKARGDGGLRGLAGGWLVGRGAAAPGRSWECDACMQRRSEHARRSHI